MSDCARCKALEAQLVALDKALEDANPVIAALKLENRTLRALKGVPQHIPIQAHPYVREGHSYLVAARPPREDGGLSFDGLGHVVERWPRHSTVVTGLGSPIRYDDDRVWPERCPHCGAVEGTECTAACVRRRLNLGTFAAPPAAQPQQGGGRTHGDDGDDDDEAGTP